jgi:hypothetical protein
VRERGREWWWRSDCDGHIEDASAMPRTAIAVQSNERNRESAVVRVPDSWGENSTRHHRPPPIRSPDSPPIALIGTSSHVHVLGERRTSHSVSQLRCPGYSQAARSRHGIERGAVRHESG